MSDYPFKLAILRALTDKLKTITPANGYKSDLSDFDPGDGVMSSRVFRGRAFFGESDPLPLVSVLEGTSPADSVADLPMMVGSGEFDWPLLVQGFVKDDKENPTDPAYVLLADVRQCLAKELKRVRRGEEASVLGFNRIYNVTIGSGIVRPADDVSAVAYFWVPVVLRIFDNAEQPYA